MSLNWNLRGIADYETKCYFTAEEDRDDLMYSYKAGEQVLHPTTYTLLFIMPAVGIGEITEANAAEVYARIHFLEMLSGAFRAKGADTKYFEPSEIAAHIGLKTNVGDEKSIPWLKRIADRHLCDYRWNYEKEQSA